MVKISKRLMKCQICYSEELEKCSDIEDSIERFHALNNFCLLLQEICLREAKIETLKNLRKAFKKRELEKIKKWMRIKNGKNN